MSGFGARGEDSGACVVVLFSDPPSVLNGRALWVQSHRPGRPGLPGHIILPTKENWSVCCCCELSGAYIFNNGHGRNARTRFDLGHELSSFYRFWIALFIILCRQSLHGQPRLF